MLIVDDDPINIMALKIILRNKFKIYCENIVDKALNGIQAIDIVK